MKIGSINYMPLDPTSPDTPTIPIDALEAFMDFVMQEQWHSFAQKNI